MIELKNINYTYGGGTTQQIHALQDVNLQIPDGQFIGLIGHTGSGKSTLIQHLNGLIKATSGDILYNGQSIYAEGFSMKGLRSKVGLVFQYPEHQLFETDVFTDVCFGPKNLGLDKETVRARARQALDLVGLDESYDKVSPFELSGGQKRRVAIAGVLAMKPDVLILDEPTAGLDPKGRDEILDQVAKLHKERGITVVLVEHVMSEVVRHADKVVVMDRGSIVMQGSVNEVFSQVDKLNELGLNVPQSIELSMKLKDKGYVSNVSLITDDIIKDLKNIAPKRPVVQQKKENVQAEKETIIDVNDLVFSYLGDTNQVDHVNLQFKKGDFVAIIGQNGAGKTTLCRSIIGLLKPTSGTIKVAEIDVSTKTVAELSGTVGYCFQNPDEQIFKDSVEDERLFGAENLNRLNDATRERINEIINDVGLDRYRKVWPKYLSKGERQRLTMGSIIAMDPDVVIVDEPTTGQDWRETIWIMDLLKKINDEGKTVIIITHNMEIVCSYCNRVLAMRYGKVLMDGTPAEVFAHPDVLETAFVQPTDITRIAQALPYMPNDVISVDEFVELFDNAMKEEV